MVPPLFASPGAPKPGRGRLLVALVAVLALAAGGGTAAWFLTRPDDKTATDRAEDDNTDKGSDDEDSDEPAADDSDGDGDSAGASAGATVSAEPSASPTTAPTPVVAPYLCWDGSPADDLAECTMPSGKEGLAYVFPSMKYAGSSCGRPISSPDIGRIAMVQCVTYLDDGSRIKVNYSKWRSVGAAREHYSGKLDVELGADGVDVYSGWVKDFTEFNYAYVYSDYPFSASAYGASETDVQNAGARFVGVGPDEVKGSATP